MIRKFVLAAGLAALFAPLVEVPASARTIDGYMLRYAPLRAGPDADYPNVGVARARTRVLVHGCLRDWSWCDISVRGNRGWVVSQHISSIYQGRRRGLHRVGQSMGVDVRDYNFGQYWDDNYQSRQFYAERSRWERQYRQNYRPSWGDGPDRGDFERGGPDRDQYRDRDDQVRGRDNQYRERGDQYRDPQGIPPRPQARMMTSGERQQQLARQQEEARVQALAQAQTLRVQQRERAEAQARADARQLADAQARLVQQRKLAAAQTAADARKYAEAQARAQTQARTLRQERDAAREATREAKRADQRGNRKPRPDPA